MDQNREITAAEQRGTGANLPRSRVGLVSDSALVPHLPPPPVAARMRGNIPASVFPPVTFPSPVSFLPMRYLLTAALLAAACSLLLPSPTPAEDDFPLGLKKLVWPEDNKHS